MTWWLQDKRQQFKLVHIKVWNRQASSEMFLHEFSITILKNPKVHPGGYGVINKPQCVAGGSRSRSLPLACNARWCHCNAKHTCRPAARIPCCVKKGCTLQHWKSGLATLEQNLSQQPSFDHYCGTCVVVFRYLGQSKGLNFSAFGFNVDLPSGIMIYRPAYNT